MFNNKRTTRLTQILVLGMTLGLMTGCSDSNPIIGNWEVMPNQNVTSLVNCKTMEFTDSEIYCNGKNPVNVLYYDIQGQDVEVFFSNGKSREFTLNDKNTLSFTYYFDQAFYKRK